jgi:hypothetical protein
MYMKKYILILSALIFTLMACKKSNDFIADNTAVTGVGSYPICANPLVEFASNKSLTGSLGTTTPSFAAGTNTSVELQYFSETPIKEINLYATVGAGARTAVYNKPYSPSFSAIKRLDTLMVPYTIPTAPATTGVKLEYEIVNQNALKITRTGWIRVL